MKTADNDGKKEQEQEGQRRWERGCWWMSDDDDDDGDDDDGDGDGDGDGDDDDDGAYYAPEPVHRLLEVLQCVVLVGLGDRVRVRFMHLCE